MQSTHAGIEPRICIALDGALPVSVLQLRQDIDLWAGPQAEYSILTDCKTWVARMKASCQYYQVERCTTQEIAPQTILRRSGRPVLQSLPMKVCLRGDGAISRHGCRHRESVRPDTAAFGPPRKHV